MQTAPQQAISQERGFTLVEILIVISIVLLLTTLGLESYANGRKRMTVDLESDKLVALLHSLREEAKAAATPKCRGLKFVKNSAPQKIETSYDAAAKLCGENREFLAVSWSPEATVSQIAAGGLFQDEFLALFAPPFGHMQFDAPAADAANADFAEITVSYKANEAVNRKVYLNKITGKLEKK